MRPLSRRTGYADGDARSRSRVMKICQRSPLPRPTIFRRAHSRGCQGDAVVAVLPAPTVLGDQFMGPSINGTRQACRRRSCSTETAQPNSTSREQTYAYPSLVSTQRSQTSRSACLGGRRREAASALPSQLHAPRSCAERSTAASRGRGTVALTGRRPAAPSATRPPHAAPRRKYRLCQTARGVLQFFPKCRLIAILVNKSSSLEHARGAQLRAVSKPGGQTSPLTEGDAEPMLESATAIRWRNPPGR